MIHPILLTALFVSLAAFGRGKNDIGIELINGNPVTAGTFTEVIEIRTNINPCTATIVGPRTFLTAASCAPDGSNVTFTFGGKPYTAKIYRSPLFADRDHDVAVGIVTQNIDGAKPVNVGGTYSIGLQLTLAGYGCTTPGGGQSDHILRSGDTVVTGVNNFDMVSRRPGGAAVCFGDLGGPAYATASGGGLVMLGVNSKGNVQDTNYHIRLDIPESQSFLKTTAQNNGVDICGITTTCTSGPTPTNPSCTMSATPNRVTAGATVRLTIFSTNATTASIEGQNATVPTGTLDVVTSTAGTITAHGTATSGSNTATCSTMYIVDPGGPNPTDPPSCTVTVIPKSVKVGGQVVIQLVAKGAANFASINNVSVAVPNGTQRITTSVVGQFPVTGFVRAASGQGSNCYADYQVLDPNTPPPPIPDFAIVPAFCGDNTDTTSNVASVCIGVVKKATNSTSLKVSHVVQLTYRDSTREVMPILYRAASASRGTGSSSEDLSLYANGIVMVDSYPVLDVRPATLTSVLGSDGKTYTPQGIQGRSSKGDVFIVDTLTAYAVANR